MDIFRIDTNEDNKKDIVKSSDNLKACWPILQTRLDLLQDLSTYHNRYIRLFVDFDLKIYNIST